MENLEKAIGLLFKRVEPSAVLDGKIDAQNITSAQFVQLSNAYGKQYSETEYNNLWQFYRDEIARDREKRGIKNYYFSGINAFDGLFYCIKQILTFQNNTVECCYAHLLEWRKLTFEISEDLLVSSFFAQKFSPAEMAELGYTWKTVIGHNNTHLNRILERGLAENHFHLYGSAPMFHISWLSLMNNPISSKTAKLIQEYDNNRRNTSTRYNASLRESPLQSKVLQAALIRLYLFAKLNGFPITIGEYNISPKKITSLISFPEKEIWIKTSDTSEDFATPLKEQISRETLTPDDCSRLGLIYELLHKLPPSSTTLFRGEVLPLQQYIVRILLSYELLPLRLFRSFFSSEKAEKFNKLWNHITSDNISIILNNTKALEASVLQIQQEIDVLRNCSNLDGFQCHLEDYTLLSLEHVAVGENAFNGLFAGERSLLFQALHEIYQQKMSSRDVNLFYAYLIIKETMRSELIQANGNVGFHNFQQYEKRKMSLIDDPVFNSAFVRHAVSENLLNEHIKLLELRISPCQTAEKNAQLIQRLDQIILNGTPENYHVKDRFFYTFHFIKQPDHRDPTELCGHYRHYERRQYLLRTAAAIAKFRSEYLELASRVLGIDAASQEIGCRPEVFSTCFRFLNNHVVPNIYGPRHSPIPQLRITYHVGEDFLDVADGLRAIDEAVYYLGIDCGDRLGHALALGIDVEAWYKSKGNTIIISQQDYMDNLMWIYERITDFNIDGVDQLKSWAAKEFELLFHKVYSNNFSTYEIVHILNNATAYLEKKDNPYSFPNHELTFDIHHYFQAWRLRGDDPELYKNGYFSWEDDGSRYEQSRIGGMTTYMMSIRYIPEVFLLYYFYHYNDAVRKEGDKIIEVKIKPFYIDGVKKLQKAMQRRVAKKGIGIETNPSSNYQIGTFKDYSKHPIFTFYNKGLTYDQIKLSECAQISVSVNTDDKGVFSTSLENELSLLAYAKENERDDKGDFLYPRSLVYGWIDDVRKMGIEQSFGVDTNSNIY